jgi:uncharacterized lipoprotein
MKPVLVLALSALELTIACASAPVRHDFERTTQFQESDFDAVWTAVIDVFGDRGWAIDNMEKDSGFIATDWMTLSRSDRDVMDCGSAGLNVDSDHAVKFNVVVRPIGNGASMTVNTTFRANRCFGDTCNLIDCVSTGGLETILVDAVRGRVSQG